MGMNVGVGSIAKISTVGNQPVYVRVSEACLDMSAFNYPSVTIKGYLMHEKDALLMANAAYLKPDLEVEKVVYNPPATVVLWKDGTKTVVKCDSRDVYDKRTGLALCFMKKALGNKSRALNDVLHKELID